MAQTVGHGATTSAEDDVVGASRVDVTVSSLAETSFEWTIDGLTASSFRDATTDDAWRSPEFRACGLRWRVVLCPKDVDAGAAAAGAYLELLERNCTFTPALAAITVAGKTYSLKRTFSTKVPAPAGSRARWGAGNGHIWPEAHPINGKLKTTVKLRACSFWLASPPVVPPSSLVVELAAMLASGECADVVCRAGGQEFSAHSFVLAMRSATLKAQLWGPFAEKPPFVLKVRDDIQPKIFERILQFIYTDQLDIQSYEEATHLLHAASFYQLQRLQAMCERVLHEKLTISNALQVLELAHMTRAAELRSVTLRFVAAHAGSLLTSEGWAELKTAHPELVDAVMHTMAHGEPPPVIASAPVKTNVQSASPVAALLTAASTQNLYEQASSCGGAPTE